MKLATKITKLFVILIAVILRNNNYNTNNKDICKALNARSL